ncbi:MAG: LysR family transcriptional regulator [Clostridia bacterium]|nr:LysR family transcriptional regulator [Clostridia bacterium]
MTLRHIKIFVAVCEYGSMTKAANALYIAQPSISTAISELEKYYNVTLFNRINQRLTLTDIGRELLVTAKEILYEFNNFESLATYHSQNPIITIGATHTLGDTIIPTFLKLIKSKGLNINPKIVIRKSATIEYELEQGNLDFAVVSGEILSPNLSTAKVSNERFIAVAHADYDIPNELTLEELTKYPLLLRETGSSSRNFLDREATSKGLDIVPKIDSSNNQSLITAVSSALGVSFLPDSSVTNYIRNKKFKEIKIKDLTATQTKYIVKHKNRRLNEIQQRAYDIFKTLL